ncbi:uncharacterized protein PRCAT00005613001 [Priceomyces carsonii]|uniref:uncharacterized protein n=1 Tax=Priceomyces carsonii TaxID=28549 RepID=UPI002EDB0180|nr:unnamed protein product [Priceomyces carsonii]
MLLDTNAILLLAFLGFFKITVDWLLDRSKDVHEIYLTQQSTVESTREADETAVHKSNKLDYSNGLRVGLDIRYDHYKLRNGNLCDVWEVLINSLKKNDEKTIEIYKKKILVSELNFKVECLQHYFKSRGIKKVGIHIKHFIKSEAVLVIIMACFINQTLVNLYDDIDVTEGVDLYFGELKQENSLSLDPNGNRSVYEILEEGKSTTFENIYTFKKDKGVALTLTRKINEKFLSSTSFTQLNLISGLASSIKHLPNKHSIDENDRLLIIQSSNASNEEILNELIKILMSFTTNCDLTIAGSMKWEDVKSYSPTVLSLSESEFAATCSLDEMKRTLTTIQKVKHYIKCRFLEREIFSRLQVFPCSIRLIYLHKSVGSKYLLSLAEINEYRSLLNSRIILESGYYRIAGPFILTDFYDYRLLPIQYKNIMGYGCLSQSVEIKVINKDNIGTVLIRGYTIGKTTMQFSSMPNEKRTEGNESNCGYMPLSDVKGKFGTDGCLYIYR